MQAMYSAVDHAEYPLMRIITLGEFALERLVPTPPRVQDEPPRYARVARSEWSHRGPAMALLKVLLCRPNRRVSRDELIEAIWPDHEAINAAHASTLRPPCSGGISCERARWEACCSRCAAVVERSSNCPGSTASG